MADRLGRGGMGEIMEAWDEQLGRGVAIERMRAGAPTARSVERFLREARIQGRLDHSAIEPPIETNDSRDMLEASSSMSTIYAYSTSDSHDLLSLFQRRRCFERILGFEPEIPGSE